LQQAVVFAMCAVTRATSSFMSATHRLCSATLTVVVDLPVVEDRLAMLGATQADGGWSEYAGYTGSAGTTTGPEIAADTTRARKLMIRSAHDREIHYTARHFVAISRETV
jgi:hypothetical protein